VRMRAAIAGLAVLTTVTIAAQPAIAADEGTTTAPTLGVNSAGFSPNSDGVQDTLALTYTAPSDGIFALEIADVDQGWVVASKILSPADAAAPLGYTPSTAGTATYRWDGTVDGLTEALPDGRYTVNFAIVHPGSAAGSGSCSIDLRNEADAVCYTLDEATSRPFEIVTSAPQVAVKTAAKTVYPVKDGYQDTAALSATFSGHAGYTVAILDPRGKAVRSWSGTGSSWKYAWNGTKANGKALPAGKYVIKAVATGKYGNANTTASTSVSTKAGKLVRRTGKRTMTPQSALDQVVVGDCSRVVNYDGSTKAWVGAHFYLSNFDYPDCDTSQDTADVAAGLYSFTLPKAMKYGSVKVSAKGHEAVPGTGDTAFMFVGDLSGPLQSLTLGSALTTYSSDWTPQKAFGSRTVPWTVATGDINFYEVQKFTVTWTYYTLQT
jgi:flagellar hook assembly protein FlgD